MNKSNNKSNWVGKEYSASLRKYAIELLSDAGATKMAGFPDAVLDSILTLPHGPREEQFILFALESNRISKEERKAA